jgi:hypothetical protein
MSFRGLVLLFLVATASISAVAGSKCLAYEPSVVTLKGTLIRKTFPGPPNYESIRKGDRAEVYWLIQLASPICVNADPSSDLNSSEKEVREVQLVMTSYAKYENLIGKRVIATGSLFSAHTAHHRTPVLLTLSKLDVIKDSH